MKKTGIFGTGVVGQTIAEKLVSLGHDVMLGTRNVQETMTRTGKDNLGRAGFKDWHDANKSVRVGTYSEAAAFGDMLINATSGHGALPALEAAGSDNLKGKVMIDISNPLDFSKGFPPSLSVCNTDSLGEQIQGKFPALKVVKSLNTMNAYVMMNPGLIAGDHSVFMNGNDDEAKRSVKELLQHIGWKAHNIIDMGDITTARGTEMLLPIWVRLYGAFKHGMFNFHIAMGQNA